jgi:serine O-acetyltransferase
MQKFASLITWINRIIFSTFIPSSARIGKNFTIGYWGLGVVIHTNNIIGENCWICQNVTIGKKGRDIKFPVIGNNVYIGAGAVIVGEIVIGDNSVIGANSFVNIDIPPNSVAVGIPAKVIKNND